MTPKKWICPLLIIVILTALLSGCGPKDTGTAAPQTTAENKSALSSPVPPAPSAGAVSKPPAPSSGVSTAGLNNACKGWGFKKEAGKKPDIAKGTQDLFAKYSAVYVGHSAQNNNTAENSGTEKILYLTFDEGYENGYTAPILDVLKSQGVPAAFFVTGPYLDKEKDLIMRMVNEGHTVGNHTINHPSMPSVTDDKKLEEELLGLDRKFKSMTGKTMKYLRPPKGEYSERTLALSHQLGYTTVFWSFAYVDWQTDKQKGADYAYSQVMPYLHDGAVLLLHAVSKDNAEALERIITDAKKQGYVFRSLDEL